MYNIYLWFLNGRHFQLPYLCINQIQNDKAERISGGPAVKWWGAFFSLPSLLLPHHFPLFKSVTHYMSGQRGLESNSLRFPVSDLNLTGAHSNGSDTERAREKEMREKECRKNWVEEIGMLRGTNQTRQRGEVEENFTNVCVLMLIGGAVWKKYIMFNMSATSVVWQLCSIPPSCHQMPLFSYLSCVFTHLPCIIVSCVWACSHLTCLLLTQFLLHTVCTGQVSLFCLFCLYVAPQFSLLTHTWPSPALTATTVLL